MVREEALSGPIAFTRDHLDAGAMAHPNIMTENMRDGSDAIADWPLLNAMVNCASQADLVAIHSGGGGYAGYMTSAGVTLIADGSDGSRRAPSARAHQRHLDSASCAMPMPATKNRSTRSRARTSTISGCRRNDWCGRENSVQETPLHERSEHARRSRGARSVRAVASGQAARRSSFRDRVGAFAARAWSRPAVRACAQSWRCRSSATCSIQGSALRAGLELRARICMSFVFAALRNPHRAGGGRARPCARHRASRAGSTLPGFSRCRHGSSARPAPISAPE